MTNVTAIRVQQNPVRLARAEFVKNAIEHDDRSVRYMAGRIGVSHSALNDRLKGKVSFFAEDIEEIARVLKRDPVRFYAEYISVGPTGIEPMTSTVESRHLATVTSIRSKTRAPSTFSSAS